MTLLKVNEVTKSYKDKKAVDGLSFEVNSGEIVGLLGKNGAGKTTIMKSICGCHSFDKGAITLNGVDIRSKHPFNQIGVLIEASFYDYLNTFENLKSLMLISGEKDQTIINHKINEVLTIVGLEKHKKSYVGSFSFGMKQRLGLAQTLLRDHELLMLDEPFVGLDPPGMTLVKNMIVNKAKEEGVGILFSSHNIKDVLEISDRIVIIDNGKKLYDGKYYKNSKTCFYTRNLAEEVSNRIKELTGINIEDNIIKLDETKHAINDVIRALAKYEVDIVKIEQHEESLDKYFEQEVTHVG